MHDTAWADGSMHEQPPAATAGLFKAGPKESGQVTAVGVLDAPRSCCASQTGAQAAMHALARFTVVCGPCAAQRPEYLAGPSLSCTGWSWCMKQAAGRSHRALGLRLAEIYSVRQSKLCGTGHKQVVGLQVADMLHKTVEQLAWAEAEAGRRAPLLAAIAQLDTARQEVAWLTAYEGNADRYKVPQSLSMLNAHIQVSRLPITNRPAPLLAAIAQLGTARQEVA